MIVIFSVICALANLVGIILINLKEFDSLIACCNEKESQNENDLLKDKEKKNNEISNLQTIELNLD